ncbi:hypothetical protein [Streptomyces narbonensis]|uniref:hypothetical protein n=1 Tax=Streptomyces narbonensis TaxID=67333 RepID=UPI00167A06B1|nr:hypothetical protein [Streptomyces narbonensis]
MVIPAGERQGWSGAQQFGDEPDGLGHSTWSSGEAPKRAPVGVMTAVAPSPGRTD